MRRRNTRLPLETTCSTRFRNSNPDRARPKTEGTGRARHLWRRWRLTRQNCLTTTLTKSSHCSPFIVAIKRGKISAFSRVKPWNLQSISPWRKWWKCKWRSTRAIQRSHTKERRGLSTSSSPALFTKANGSVHSGTVSELKHGLMGRRTQVNGRKIKLVDWESSRTPMVKSTMATGKTTRPTDLVLTCTKMVATS